MAAPHVAGIVALLESYDSSLSGPDKVQTIVSNVIPYDDSRDLGSGIANARLALEALVFSDELMMFLDVWLHEKTLLAADLNRDGIVNLQDFAFFSKDYVVPEDLMMFLDVWLHEKTPLAADLNRDGIVNLQDFAILSKEYHD
jgi:hypothetical protein